MSNALLVEWRWLCKQPMTLVARNAFGDLFLRDKSGRIDWLDVAVGKLTRIADSEKQFRELARSRDKQEEWFAFHISYPNSKDIAAARKLGVSPGGEIMQHGLPKEFAFVWERHRFCMTGPTDASPSGTRRWMKLEN